MSEAVGIAERLRERTAMKYMGDCKCGICQLVPHADVAEAAILIAAMTKVLQDIDTYAPDIGLDEFRDAVRRGRHLAERAKEPTR
jgi:hypothetical protein